MVVGSQDHYHVFSNFLYNNVLFYFRKQQEAEEFGGLEENPALMNELRALRLRKNELETHLTTLQDSRKHLMVQLEGLMKLLKVIL